MPGSVPRHTTYHLRLSFDIALGQLKRQNYIIFLKMANSGPNQGMKAYAD